MAHQILAILLLFGVLEVGTRLVFDPVRPIEIRASTLLPDGGREPFFQQHPFAAHAWIPNARIGAQHVNSDGFVSTREIPFEKAPDELRVVTLGGSSTVGNLNRDEETYPRVLERRLQTSLAPRPVSVINAAAGGYTTMESLGYFARRMIYYQPDVVLLMHAWNDLYYFSLNDKRLSERRKHLYDKALWTPWNFERDPMPPVVRAMSWSQLFLHLRAWLESNQFFRGGAPTVIEVAPDPTVSKPVYERKSINPNAYDTYRTNLQQIKALCDLRGITCFSILQPTLLTPDADRSLDKVIDARETAMVHGFDADEHVLVFQRLYDINREVFGDAHCIDATALSGDDTLFHDHIHMNARGTGRLADLVLQTLQARSERLGL